MWLTYSRHRILFWTGNVGSCLYDLDFVGAHLFFLELAVLPMPSGYKGVLLHGLSK